MRCRRWVLVAILAAAPGCDDPTSPAPPPPLCEAGTTLVAGTGAIPSFTWSPACRAGGLSVSGPQVFWHMTLPTNVLVPPLEYGEEPEGAQVVGQADPLAIGEEHTAVLLLVTESRALDTVVVVTFVP